METKQAIKEALEIPAEELSKGINCWEYKKCGRGRTGGNCPAFPHYGRVCWRVAGTMCGGIVQGTFAQKIKNCELCEFYKNVKAKKI